MFLRKALNKLQWHLLVLWSNIELDVKVGRGFGTEMHMKY